MLVEKDARRMGCMRNVAGRVLSFALVAMLVMSAVGLAASQTFINKTGKTVTGIKVEFSKSVRITRHDAVFSDQDPSGGRGQEFTFSGGELHNSGRFTITWLPSSGKVVDYEWIEKAQPAQTPQTSSPSTKQGSALPDPNTPPILYGDDYPGPDEPLYQPADDEQIWLTDIDGHADIYDNDSIRINYAPGFDKSQITKIDVYRNGIKLRFLPDTFDVLTNAQMKTFDGNYREHSPASNHTDHAIMGYEYKFRIQTADHLWMFTKTVKSGFRWRPKEIWAEMGISWHWNEIDSLSFDDIVKFLTYLKRDGFTGISVDIPYYVMTPYDSDVIKVYSPEPGIATRGGIITPTSERLEKMLKAAQEAGVYVHIRGHLYISQKYKDEYGFMGCSSDIDPRNPERFFDGYTTLLLKLVPLLNKYHVKLLTPFTEMDGIEKYPGLIKEMYTTVSEQFDGEMGFEEATHNMLTGDSYINPTPIHTVSAFESLVRNFTFWDWKDSHGRPMRIEYSCWNPPVETQMDQRVSVMEPNFVKFWSIPVDYYRSKYPDDSQMFGEIGARNADGQSLGSAYWDIKNKVIDEQERADYILAALIGTKRLQDITAFDFWGGFYIGDSEAPAVPWVITSTGHYGRPASPIYRVIKAIIKPDGD